ncbi:MAG: alpha/beta fold hydrolase, partial [bacterium]
IEILSMIGDMKISPKTILLRYLRVAYAVLVFALSLLAIFRAPTHLLWMLAIGVTEYGHVLAMLSLLVLLPGWRNSTAGRLSAVLGLIAAFVAMTSILRAVPINSRLPQQFEMAFGKNGQEDTFANRNPLDLSDLLLGIELPTIESTTHLYGKTEGQSLTLDLYRPISADTANPGVVIIHGGAWRSGDSKGLPDLNRYLAGKGYVVASLNYRLAPDSRYPAPIEDITQAIAYLKTHAAEFVLDPTRIILLGRSAGAQLALQVAYTARDPAIRGVVSFYGPADLYYGYTHPANPLVIDTRGVLESFLGGNPDEVPEVYQEASPYQHVDASTPPTLLVHGARDELVSPEQSRRLAARLRENSVPHVYLELPWATHACDFNLSGPSGQLSVYAIERFLGAVK